MFAEVDRELSYLPPSPRPAKAAQARQVRQLISRSQAILLRSLIAELFRAVTCCTIAKLKDEKDSLRYLMVAEATSAKFMKLRSQGRIAESKTILGAMSLLEEELGGRLPFSTIY